MVLKFRLNGISAESQFPLVAVLLQNERSLNLFRIKQNKQFYDHE